MRPQFANPLESNDRQLDQVLHFGKHRGLSLREIGATDAKYLDWLVGQKTLDPSLRPAVEYACKEYGRQIERARR